MSTDTTRPPARPRRSASAPGATIDQQLKELRDKVGALSLAAEGSTRVQEQLGKIQTYLNELASVIGDSQGNLTVVTNDSLENSLRVLRNEIEAIEGSLTRRLETVEIILRDDVVPSLADQRTRLDSFETFVEQEIRPTFTNHHERLVVLETSQNASLPNTGKFVAWWLFWAAVIYVCLIFVFSENGYQRFSWAAGIGLALAVIFAFMRRKPKDPSEPSWRERFGLRRRSAHQSGPGPIQRLRARRASRKARKSAAQAQAQAPAQPQPLPPPTGTPVP